MSPIRVIDGIRKAIEPKLLPCSTEKCQFPCSHVRTVEQKSAAHWRALSWPRMTWPI